MSKENVENRLVKAEGAIAWHMKVRSQKPEQKESEEEQMEKSIKVLAILYEVLGGREEILNMMAERAQREKREFNKGEAVDLLEIIEQDEGFKELRRRERSAYGKYARCRDPI